MSGVNPRKSAFPKGGFIRDKAAMGPGPGSYTAPDSMAKQVLSTKVCAPTVGFPKSERKSMVQEGLSEVGPGEYKPPAAACDDQFDSRRPTCAKIKFGEGYRKGATKDKFDFKEPSPGYSVFILFCIVHD